LGMMCRNMSGEMRASSSQVTVSPAVLEIGDHLADPHRVPDERRVRQERQGAHHSPGPASRPEDSAARDRRTHLGDPRVGGGDGGSDPTRTDLSAASAGCRGGCLLTRRARAVRRSGHTCGGGLPGNGNRRGGRRPHGVALAGLLRPSPSRGLLGHSPFTELAQPPLSPPARSGTVRRRRSSNASCSL